MQSIFYVIDIQSPKNFEESLDYLQDIINILSLEPQLENFQLLILLHKFDPDIELTNKEVNKEVVQTLISNIHDAIPPNFEFELHKSSIYTVFERSSIE